ncbi:NrdH-redoxin [Rothia sp. AR01]|uniref:NrdH-redoxin n=1 Tax=Rothia santali TaxID=2949643 RepID=A0A9X2HCP0_9MICC|nr:glutaredoxin domain-containing protein [Rothia santali]MCP3426921.1 NrdH-redoxin [Rothia santali]
MTFYTKPACVQCAATFCALDSHDITYDVVDLTEGDAALERIKELGYLRSPVVVTETEHWSGFCPDKIETLNTSTNTPKGDRV